MNDYVRILLLIFNKVFDIIFSFALFIFLLVTVNLRLPYTRIRLKVFALVFVINLSPITFKTLMKLNYLLLKAE